MAKFLTITQNGYTFTVHDADKLVADEEWGIERVSAFISLHHVLNVMATRYTKGMTFRLSVASIMYTLKCDPVTSKDLNKLNNYLIRELCGIYDDPQRQGFLGRPLSVVLDDIEVKALDYIKESEAPVEALGKTVTPPPFFSRPSKAEYDAQVAGEKAVEQQLWDNFRAVLDSGHANGHSIKMRDGSNVYTCYITKVSPKCIYCDVKDEYNRLLQSGARFPRDSKRFIIGTFR